MRSSNYHKSLTWVVIFLLCHTGITKAQNTPGGPARPVATATTVPIAYTGTAINYIRTWEPSMPTSDPVAVTGATDIKMVKQTTQYFDGLGRLLQTVSKGTAPSGKDVVVPVVYDVFGREQYEYLPYIPQGDNTNDGKFKTNPFSRQKAFYEDTILNPGAKGESVYYDQTLYEASPLSRVLKSYASGNSWAAEGGNKPVEQLYQLNTAADSVRIWDMPATGIIPVSGSGRIYAAGVLFKNIIKDQRGIRVVEFKDKAGRVVLKKAEQATNAADGHAAWLCTYYVYDDLENLRCIIPPKAVRLIQANWVIDAVTARELCFFYRYDNRNRMIVKKVPGADSTELVYDVRDRLVFLRDINLKNPSQTGGSKWLVTFYDGINRPVMTALYSSASTRDALQTSMNTVTASTQSISYTFPAVADLVVATHDKRPVYEAANSIVMESGFDTGVGAETLAEIDGAANQGSVTIAASNPLPNIPASALTPLTYTFYDNYSFTGAQAAQTGDFSKPQPGSNPYAEPITAVSNMTQGLVTGTKVKVLDTPDRWITNTTYYNDKGRVIQAISDNISGGQDILTTLYDFNGKLLSNYVRHKNLRSGTTPETTMLTMLHYDAAGRVDSLKKRLNDVDSLQRTIAFSSYDELGRLKSKRLGVTGATTQMEILNYEYNIRGWLKAINKAFANTPGSGSNWFGQEISYDYGFLNNQYNGSIAGIKWRSKGDSIARAYGYTYDNVNRLTVADFTQQNKGSTSWTRDKMDFSVSGLTYDANGNINAMTQKGMIGTGISTIDQLTYTYQPNSNKLAAVADPASTAAARLGDFVNGTNTGDDYLYDASGNFTKDRNKNIDTILYNHLNMPESIAIRGKGRIQYQYDALGNKLRKIVTDSTVVPVKTTTTDYIGGFVYKNDTLQFVRHEEGRIRTVFKTGMPLAFKYDYFVRDHLSSIRVVLTEQTDFAMYAATMEAENAAAEASLFSNIDESRTASPVGYPEDQTTRKNEYVARLNAKDGGKKIGPSLVLRVMAGDTVQIGARAFYKSIGPKDNKSVTPEDMLASLLQVFGGASSSNSSHAGRQADRISPFGNFNGSDYQRLKEKDPDQNRPDKPKAYLNFALFDDQFNLVDQNSGVRQVKGTPDELQTLAVDKMPIEKSGFLYVYTSNETAQDVFFDNLVVENLTGPLLEETHYYPFGLTMAGISSNAIKTNYAENKYKFNHGSELQNKEFSDGSGLELYETPLRSLDPQLGRWLQIDAKPHEMMSPYIAMANNPLLYSDPGGDTTFVFGLVGQYLGTIPDTLKNQVHFMPNANSKTKPFDASKMTPKEATKLAQRVRSASVAFIGGKTAADLKAIAKQSAALGKELAFVGAIGPDKEIRLTAMAADENNHENTVNIPAQMDKYYSKEQQAGFFLFGHVHHGSGISVNGSEMAQHKEMGNPTFTADYKPALYRGGNVNDKGQSPAIIATPYGLTVYGTGVGANSTYGEFKGSIKINSENSYFLYRNLNE